MRHIDTLRKLKSYSKRKSVDFSEGEDATDRQFTTYLQDRLNLPFYTSKYLTTLTNIPTFLKKTEGPKEAERSVHDIVASKEELEYFICRFCNTSVSVIRDAPRFSKDQVYLPRISKYSLTNGELFDSCTCGNLKVSLQSCNTPIGTKSEPIDNQEVVGLLQVITKDLSSIFLEYYMRTPFGNLPYMTSLAVHKVMDEMPTEVTVKSTTVLHHSDGSSTITKDNKELGIDAKADQELTMDSEDNQETPKKRKENYQKSIDLLTYSRLSYKQNTPDLEHIHKFYATSVLTTSGIPTAYKSLVFPRFKLNDSINYKTAIDTNKEAKVTNRPYKSAKTTNRPIEPISYSSLLEVSDSPDMLYERLYAQYYNITIVTDVQIAFPSGLCVQLSPRHHHNSAYFSEVFGIRTKSSSSYKNSYNKDTVSYIVSLLESFGISKKLLGISSDLPKISIDPSKKLEFPTKLKNYKWAIENSRKSTANEVYPKCLIGFLPLYSDNTIRYFSSEWFVGSPHNLHKSSWELLKGQELPIVTSEDVVAVATEFPFVPDNPELLYPSETISKAGREQLTLHKGIIQYIISKIPENTDAKLEHIPLLEPLISNIENLEWCPKNLASRVTIEPKIILLNQLFSRTKALSTTDFSRSYTHSVRGIYKPSKSPKR